MVARPTDLALDDASLVYAAQTGDPDAFAELFKRHYPQVKRVVARKLGNLRDADEIAQSAFVRAYERIDRCGGDRRFGAWVQVIANNLAVDHIRAAARTQPSEEPVRGDAALGPNAPEDSVLRGEQVTMLRRALETLPVRQRDVVLARDVDGRRPPEIAAAMGLTLGAVDSILLRGRRRLANAVESMTAETGSASLATTTTVTATGTAAVAHSGSFQRLVGAVADLVARASFQVASSIGMVPGAESVGSQATQVAAAGLLWLAPAGVADHAVPDAPVAVTATFDGVNELVDSTEAAAADAAASAPVPSDPAAIPAPPPVAPPAADPAAAPPAPPAPAPEPAPEPAVVVADVLGDPLDAVGSLVGRATKTLR